MSNEYTNKAVLEVVACGEPHTICSNEVTVKKVVIRVEKMQNKECVFEGDYVEYCIKIFNECSVLIDEPVFCDDLPHGLVYVPGTFEVNGKTETPAWEPYTNRVTFKLKHLTPNSETEITFRAKVE